LQEISYRPDIDGLRALAVLLVVLCHAGLGPQGGYVGVDIFFVISGYLITGQILKDLRDSSFKQSQFWIRRVRRILPGSMAMVLTTLIVGFFILLPQDYEDLGKSAIYQQLMLANFYFWQTAGYFDGPSDSKPLLHMWSLAVEEQFYLLYPPVLALLYQRFRRFLPIALIVAFIGSLAISHIGVQIYRTPAFYLLPTRAWELLAGALLWWVPPLRLVARTRIHLASAIASISLGAIVVIAVLYNKETVFPGAAAIPPCLATATLIYIHSQSQSQVSSFLSHPLVVFVGLISYSWYLWHWPLFAFFRYLYGSEVSILFACLLVLFSFLMAIVSYKLIETPFRKGRFRYWTSHQILGAVLIIALATTGLSFLILITSGASFRFSRNFNQLVSKQQGAVLAKFDGRLFEEGTNRLFGVGMSSIIEADESIDFIVWGDSHARMLYNSMDKLAKEQQLRGVIASKSGTGPFPSVLSAEANNWNSRVLKLIKDRRIPKVLLVGKWDDKLKKNKSQEQSSLLTLVRDLTDQGVNVSILMQVPRQNFDPNPAIARSLYFGTPIPGGLSRYSYLRNRKPLDNFVLRLRDQSCQIIDPLEQYFDERGLSRLGDEGESFYWDDDHLSPRGVEALLDQSIIEWLVSPPNDK